MTRLFLAALLALAATPAFAAPDPKWGIYAELAGGAWRSKMSSGDVELTRYSWIRPGEVLRAEHRLAGTPFVTVETITPGPGPGRITVSTKESDRDEPTRSTVTLNPDGSATETFVGRLGYPERATYSPVVAGRYTARTEAQQGGQWREIWSAEVTKVQD